MVRDTHDDDEKLTFISLAALTANVTRYLGLAEKKEDSGNEGNTGKEGDQIALAQRELVRLREIVGGRRK